MQRYFAKEKRINTFILNNDDIYHIKTVMRMKDGDSIYVVYDEKTYICCLESVNNDIKICIEKECIKEEEWLPKVCLYVPVLQEQKMDYILQKATELGVFKIVPIVTERTIIRVNESNMDKKLTRWKRICKEASEQSHRTTIPIIDSVTSILKLEKKPGLNLVCSTTHKEKNLKYMLQSNKDCDTINIVMGPEGGLSKKEEEYLINVGFIPTTFGNRILRVETVPLFVLSVINFEYME